MLGMVLDPELRSACTFRALLDESGGIIIVVVVVVVVLLIAMRDQVVVVVDAVWTRPLCTRRYDLGCLYQDI